MKRAGICQLFEQRNGRFGKCPFMVHQALERQLFEAFEDDIFARQEIPWIEDLVEHLFGEMRIGISLKTLTVTRPINGILECPFPNFHGITLHDHISVLARNTRIHEGEQHLRREDKTLRAPKVCAPSSQDRFAIHRASIASWRTYSRVQ